MFRLNMFRSGLGPCFMFGLNMFRLLPVRLNVRPGCRTRLLVHSRHIGPLMRYGRTARSMLGMLLDLRVMLFRLHIPLTGSARRNDVMGKIPRPGTGGYSRLAMIGGGGQSRIMHGGLRVLHLFLRRRRMMLVRDKILLRRRLHGCAAWASGKAGIGGIRNIGDVGGVCNIRDVRHIGNVGDIGDGAIDDITPLLPSAADKTRRAVTSAIIDAAVKADVRPPITFMPEERTFHPPPIAGRP